MDNMITIVSNSNPFGEFPGGMVVHFKVNDVDNTLKECEKILYSFNLKNGLKTGSFSTVIDVNTHDYYCVKEEDLRVDSPLTFLKKYLPEIKNIFTKRLMEELSLITLDTGYLYNNYGKYKPNLTLICREPLELFGYQIMTLNDLNLGSNQEVEVLRGNFFTSKKGTKCFKVDTTGKDILVEHSWGGADKYADRDCYLDKLPQQKYFRRASSNGGGVGTDYVVIPEGTTYVVREEDI